MKVKVFIIVGLTCLLAGKMAETKDAYDPWRTDVNAQMDYMAAKILLQETQIKLLKDVVKTLLPEGELEKLEALDPLIKGRTEYLEECEAAYDRNFGFDRSEDQKLILEEK